MYFRSVKEEDGDDDGKDACVRGRRVTFDKVACNHTHLSFCAGGFQALEGGFVGDGDIADEVVWGTVMRHDVNMWVEFVGSFGGESMLVVVGRDCTRLGQGLRP